MGSFSWLKADNTDEVINVPAGGAFKFLIPKEFGGGFVLDNEYGDYGYLDNNKYDMYEILAFWNKDRVAQVCKNALVGELGENGLKPIDANTDCNRSLGIDIGCYDRDVMELKYPLKLVSVNYEGTYEDCEGRSYSDPNQGFYPVMKGEEDLWRLNGKT